MRNIRTRRRPKTSDSDILVTSSSNRNSGNGNGNGSHLHSSASNSISNGNVNGNVSVNGKGMELYSHEELTQPVTPDEFLKAVPRYPNDGVLLIDVDKYNALNILADIDALAGANGRGEYAVGTYECTCA